MEETHNDNSYMTQDLKGYIDGTIKCPKKFDANGILKTIMVTPRSNNWILLGEYNRKRVCRARMMQFKTKMSFVKNECAICVNISLIM